jgi:predicted dehydrogenase
MAVRLAIVGVDPVQRDWVGAVEELRAAGEIEVVGAGHRTVALARDLADEFSGGGEAGRVPAYDDLRLMLNERQPQVVVLDRPENMTLELLLSCASQKIGVISVGPPVETVAEAQALSEVLEARTHLLYVWPRMVGTFGYRQAAGAEDFGRPVRFASATWLGMNHAMAKAAGGEGEAAAKEGVVRSLSVLAWDALATLIELIDVPTTVYASVRGTVGMRDTFADMSGAAALTLRFPEDGAASVTLSDRMPGRVAPGGERSLLLFAQGCTARIEAERYEFHDGEGRLMDEGSAEEKQGTGGAGEALREFLHHFQMPASPVRGWEHRLEAVAATMEAVVVSHRTGQAESPERFWRLRR